VEQCHLVSESNEANLTWAMRPLWHCSHVRVIYQPRSWYITTPWRVEGRVVVVKVCSLNPKG